MPPKSLAEVLIIYRDFLYTEHQTKAAKEIFDQTLIAFTYYMLRAWNGPFSQKRKLKPHEIEAAYKFMGRIELLQLKDAVKIQAEIFKQLNSTDHEKYVYGSRLKQLLTWVKTQSWWTYADEPLPPKQYAPRYDHGHKSVYSKNVSGRTLLPPYSLKPEETPAALQKILDEFYQFLTKSRWPGRHEGPLKDRTAENHLISIRRILGWFKLYARPIYDDENNIIGYSNDETIQLLPIEKLSLELLVPKVSLKNVEHKEEAEIKAQQAAEYLDLWLCKFLDFLEVERESKSWKTLFSELVGVQALVRFQYYQETADHKYRDIPAMEKIRQHLCLISRNSNTHERVSDIDMQWLELPEVWQKIVNPLRYECVYRTSTGHLRNIRAIAQSFQLFLIWGCLTFRPPRRQQEFRELRISMSCPLARPKGAKNGQFIHPLPVNRHEDKDHGYLYKAENGIWYMDMTPESYKTGSTYGHQKLEIPNTPFSDGKCFYDYLEAFLYGYYRNSKGEWHSGGKLAETPDEKGCWYSLRMAFNPSHNHVFGQPRSGGVFDESEFGKIVRASANRLTGQRLSPHLLRDVFATWFLDQGYTSDRIASLAHAMGNSEEMLRETYDLRRSEQKNRPIEETMSNLISQIMV